MKQPILELHRLLPPSFKRTWNSPLVRLGRWLFKWAWRGVRFCLFPNRVGAPDRGGGYVHVCKPVAADCHEWPLSMEILRWNPNEPVLLSDILCGVQAWGVTGGGKSSGIVTTMAKAFFSHGFGVFCMTVKPEEPQFYYSLAKEAGREQDVIFLGPSHPTTFNFLREAARGGAGMVPNLVTVLTCASKLALGGQEQGDRESGGFWQKMDQRLIASVAELLILAGQPVTTMNMERVVLTLPTCRADVADPMWKSGSFMYECLSDADARALTPDDREDLVRLAGFFLVSMAELADKTRGTVQTSVSSTLDMFNGRVARRLLSAPEPNFDFEMLQRGKILIVDMPCMTHGTTARLIQTVLKHSFQMCQNRRDVGANPRPVGLICDESQMLVDLEHDAKFLTTARSTRTGVCLATQSLSNYLSEHGGDEVEPRVHAMISNLVCQVFNQTTDTKTVSYAQELLGKRTQLLMNASTQQQQENWADTALGLAGPSAASAGFSEHLDHIIQADDLHDLAKGGPPDFTVEALVYSGGKSFQSTKSPFLPVRFRQTPHTK